MGYFPNHYILTHSRLELSIIFYSYTNKWPPNITLYLEWPPDFVKGEHHCEKEEKKERNCGKPLSFRFRNDMTFLKNVRCKREPHINFSFICYMTHIDVNKPTNLRIPITIKLKFCLYCLKTHLFFSMLILHHLSNQCI